MPNEIKVPRKPTNLSPCDCGGPALLAEHRGFGTSVFWIECGCGNSTKPYSGRIQASAEWENVTRLKGEK